MEKHSHGGHGQVSWVPSPRVSSSPLHRGAAIQVLIPLSVSSIVLTVIPGLGEELCAQWRAGGMGGGMEGG